ncbi:MAG: ABC-F family ATP-binding cassette domain-containing protein [Lachnospiraceae bacterium]
MNLLTAENITKAYTERVLLDHAFFSLNEGEKVGVIGINGTGKSTLLKILSGLEEPDEGTITKANHVVIRYLPQNPELKEGETVLDSVIKDAAVKDDVWTVEANAKAMLMQLGIQDFDACVNHLSGGQRKRIALAAVLLSPADILVLDEPTNHLDNDMAEWLEEYLRNYRKSLIMVTHDRYFLDSVSNRIIEIDKGSIFSYQTNYSGFLELKAEREAMELAGERKRQSILRTELEWIKRGARARSTKQKARIERYEELNSKAAPTTDGHIEMSSISTRLGRTTIELDHLSKSFGNRALITDFSYIFLKGDRIGFIGENGCGKTTLMKMIVGKVEPDFGQIEIGQTVKIGYYSQEIETNVSKDNIAYMNPESRVIDYIKDTAEYVRTTDGLISASQMLEKFLFPSSMQYSLIGKLSGGEKRRLNLLRVLMEAPNVLILDEPTNDLDIQTLTILEDYLDQFEGIVICVSHDRYFLDRCVRRIFAFENGTIRQYEGGYTDYRIVHEQEMPQNAVEKVEDKKQQKNNNDTYVKPKKLKFTYKEQKEWDTIEEDIASLEARIEDLEKQMIENARDFVKLNAISKEKEEAENQLEEKMDRWMYLTELDEKIREQNQK